MFGKQKEIFWLSKIILSQDRDQNISICFDLKVNLEYPQALGEFNIELDFFIKQKKKLMIVL